MRPDGTPPRLPPNYGLVLEVVRALEDGVHISAAEVFTRARSEKASIGHATVYRALGRLCRLGLVLELHVPGLGAALYEPARARHAHFVCVACGRIEDIECAIPAQDIAAAVEAGGGAIDEIVLTINGRCAACRSRHQNAAS